MCAEGVVGIAIFALAMVFTLPAALHQQQPYGWFGAGAYRAFDAHQQCVEAQSNNAVVSWRLVVQRRVGRGSCLSPYMAARRVARQHMQQGCRMDLLTDALSVLTTR